MVYIPLLFFKILRRNYPHNLIVLGVLTLAMSLLTMVVCAFFNVIEVLIAFGITTLACLIVILFSIQTRVRFAR
jgi:FtsH-binding integral membrane protein